MKKLWFHGKINLWLHRKISSNQYMLQTKSKPLWFDEKILTGICRSQDFAVWRPTNCIDTVLMSGEVTYTLRLNFPTVIRNKFPNLENRNSNVKINIWRLAIWRENLEFLTITWLSSPPVAILVPPFCVGFGWALGWKSMEETRSRLCQAMEGVSTFIIWCRTTTWNTTKSFISFPKFSSQLLISRVFWLTQSLLEPHATSYFDSSESRTSLIFNFEYHRKIWYSKTFKKYLMEILKLNFWEFSFLLLKFK